MFSWLVLGLIFGSKISFQFLPFVPFALGPLIYQHGLHPYINLAFHIPLSFLALKGLKHAKTHNNQILIYRLTIALLVALLATLAFFQYFSFDSQPPLIEFFGATLSAILLILLYTRWIPQLITVETLLLHLRILSVSLCIISLTLWVFGADTVYRGGRFIGVFKHIPHMVSTSTLAFILMIPLLFESHKKILRNVALWALQSLLFLSLLLTGTRSAVAAALGALIIGFFLFDRATGPKFILKVGLSISLIFIALFFGSDIGSYISSVARGETALGLRAAQDGLAARWEEVLRGAEIFSQEPLTGKGFLFKYQGTSGDLQVGGYDSFKDPHNYFISAGVIGGWPLIFIMSFFVLLVMIQIWQKLRSHNPNFQIIALYVLVHIPILMIYHQHFSLGGVADRLYWIMFGYLAVKNLQSSSAK